MRARAWRIARFLGDHKWRSPFALSAVADAQIDKLLKFSLGDFELFGVKFSRFGLDRVAICGYVMFDPVRDILRGEGRSRERRVVVEELVKGV